eukprot:sb/3472177/
MTDTEQNFRSRRVQFATPRVSIDSDQMSSGATSGVESPPAWRRTSTASIVYNLQEQQKRKKKKCANKSWTKISQKIESRRRKESQRVLSSCRETHLPALDVDAVKRATSAIRSRSTVPPVQDPTEEVEVPLRPSTELKNRLRDYKLPLSYNNFIVRELEVRFKGPAYYSG